MGAYVGQGYTMCEIAVEVEIGHSSQAHACQHIQMLSVRCLGALCVQAEHNHSAGTKYASYPLPMGTRLLPLFGSVILVHATLCVQCSTSS